MAKKKDSKSVYGMRLIDSYDKFIGLLWEELSLDKLVLRFYHINEYGEYVSDEVISMNADVLYGFERKEDALTYLKRAARAKEASYNLYIDEDLYNGIIRYYEDRRKLSEIID